MTTWQRFKLLIDRLVQMLCQGAIIKAAGDDDTFDVIDHKTGKPRLP